MEVKSQSLTDQTLSDKESCWRRACRGVLVWTSNKKQERTGKKIYEWMQV